MCFTNLCNNNLYKITLICIYLSKTFALHSLYHTHEAHTNIDERFLKRIIDEKTLLRSIRRIPRDETNCFVDHRQVSFSLHSFQNFLLSSYSSSIYIIEEKNTLL